MRARVSVPVCAGTRGRAARAPGGGAAAAAARPGASRCAGLERAPFCEIYKILPGKKPPGAAATQRPASPPPYAGPGRREPGPGDCGICREGLSPPRPRAPLEPRAAHRLRRRRLGPEPGAPGGGERRPGRRWLRRPRRERSGGSRG